MTSKIVDQFIESNPFLKSIFSYQNEKGYVKKVASKQYQLQQQQQKSMISQDISILDDEAESKLMKMQIENKEQQSKNVVNFDQFERLEDVIKIKSIKEKYPMRIDFRKELEQLLDQNTFIRFQVRSMQDKFEKCLLSEENEEFIRIIFYRVLSLHYPDLFDISQDQFKDNCLNIADLTKIKLAKKYLKAFTRLPKPKDQLIHYLIFADIYAVNMICFKMLKSEKEKFNIQFFFNILHIVIYETTGIFVSESYIHTSIDRFFTQKFMEYEREEYVRLQKIINQQNKIKEEQFLGFALPKIKDNGVIDQRFQDNISRILNHKRGGNKKRCQSQNSISRQKVRGDDSISIAPSSSHHQSFSITQPLLISREKRSISNQRMSKSFKDDDNNSQKLDMSEIIDSMKESSSTDRKFYRRNFNCAMIGPAMSNALEKQERVLVGIPQNIVQHTIKVRDGGRANIHEMLEDLKKVRQQRRDYKQQEEVVKKVDMLQQYGLDYQEKVALGREHYINKNEELQKKFLENMIEMNYVLRKKREQANTLPSSQATLAHLKRLKFEYMEEGIPDFFMKKHLTQTQQSQNINDNNSDDNQNQSNPNNNNKGNEQTKSSEINLNLNLIQEEDDNDSQIYQNKLDTSIINIRGQENSSILKKPSRKMTTDQNNNSDLKEKNNNSSLHSPTKTINFLNSISQSNLNHQTTNKSFYPKSQVNIKNIQSYSRLNSAQTKTEPSPIKSFNSTFIHTDKNLSFSQKLNHLTKKLNLNNHSERELSEQPKRRSSSEYEDTHLESNRRIKTVIVTKDVGPSEEEIYDKYHNRNNKGKNTFDQMILDQQQKDLIRKPNKNKFDQMYNDMIYKTPSDKQKEYENLQYKFQKSVKTAYKARDICKKMKLISHQADKMIERLNFK